MFVAACLAGVADPLAPSDDDYAAITTAIADAPENGVVQLGSGTFTITNEIAISEGGAKLQGEIESPGWVRDESGAWRLFDACSDGRLLMLAPAAWPYVPGEKVMTRFDATHRQNSCTFVDSCASGEDEVLAASAHSQG